MMNEFEDTGRNNALDAPTRHVEAPDTPTTRIAAGEAPTATGGGAPTASTITILTSIGPKTTGKASTVSNQTEP